VVVIVPESIKVDFIPYYQINHDLSTSFQALNAFTKEKQALFLYVYLQSLSLMKVTPSYLSFVELYVFIHRKFDR